MNDGREGNPQLRLVAEPRQAPASADELLAYFSGPLTWYAKTEPERLEVVTEIAQTVEECLEEAGIRVHVPHRDVDHSDGDRTYWQNRLTIARSDLVVAFYDFPSTGMGQELEIAAAYARPIILLVNERRTKMSTMISTAFFRAERLVYDDRFDLARQLPAMASGLIASSSLSASEQFQHRLGATLRERREDLGMGRATLGAEAHCSVELIRHLEDDDADVLSPSLRQIEWLAAALDIGVDALLGLATEKRSLERRVFDFAAKSEYSARDALEVVAIAARDAEIDSDAEIAQLFEALKSYGDGGPGSS